jgi:hypothetical protein
LQAAGNQTGFDADPPVKGRTSFAGGESDTMYSRRLCPAQRSSRIGLLLYIPLLFRIGIDQIIGPFNLQGVDARNL